MADEPGTLVLVDLRRLDAKMDDVREDIRDMKARLIRVEAELGRLVRDRGEDMEARVHLPVQVDRLRDEIGHLNCRLDITD